MTTKHYPVVVIGAGIAGVIASTALYRKGIEHIVLEKSWEMPQPQLHYFHRDDNEFFQSTLQMVDIHKALFWNGEFVNDFNIEMHNHYSYVTTKKLFNNSTKFVGGLGVGWVPKYGWGPFYHALSSTLPIKLGINVGSIDHQSKKIRCIDENKDEFDGNQLCFEYDHLIITAPLPFITNKLKHLPQVRLQHDPLIVDSFELNEGECDPAVHQIIYFPKADFGYARVSLLGNRIVAERASQDFRHTNQQNTFINFLTRWIPVLSERKERIVMKTATNPIGRYVGINEEVRSEIIKQLHQSNIYPVGRYAQWTYKRVDHVIDDVELLVGSMKGGKQL